MRILIIFNIYLFVQIVEDEILFDAVATAGSGPDKRYSFIHLFILLSFHPFIILLSL